MNLNPDYIAELMTLINRSPFPQHMAMQLKDVEMDRAKVLLEVSDYHYQPYGIVHGGVLATLIDTATFWSAFLRIPEDAGLVNIDLKLNYLLPVKKGPLVAQGRCLKSGRSISYAEAGVLDAEGRMVAHGTSTLMTLPGKGLRVKAERYLAL